MADSNLNILLKAKDDATRVIRSLNTELRRVQQNINQLGGGIRITGLQQASRNARSTAQNVRQVGQEGITAARRIAPISTRLNQASLNAETLVSNISNSRGQLLATAATAALLVSAFKNAAEEFFKVELAIAEVSTLVDSSVISNEALAGSVRKLSDEFGIAQTEVSKGLYQAISAGAEAGAEATELLNVALQVATGGLTDVNTAVDGLTTIINAFGFSMSDAGHVADVLFTTMKNGKTTIEELSQRFFQVAPLASSVGASFEEVSAAVIALTLQGTKTRVAMTQIRAALAGLARDNPEVKKAFRDIGFESLQAALAGQGLEKTFRDLAREARGNQGQLQKLVGSIEGVQAILGTTGKQAEFFVKGLKEIDDSVGNSFDAFSKVAGTDAKNFEQAITRVINSFIEFGELVKPTITFIAETVASVVEGAIVVIKSYGEVSEVFISVATTLAIVVGGLTLLVVVAGFAATAFNVMAPFVISVANSLRTVSVTSVAAADGIGTVAVSANTANKALIGLRASLLALTGIAIGEIFFNIALASIESTGNVERLESQFEQLEKTLSRISGRDFAIDPKELLDSGALSVEAISKLSNEEILKIESGLKSRLDILKATLNTAGKDALKEVNSFGFAVNEAFDNLITEGPVGIINKAFIGDEDPSKLEKSLNKTRDSAIDTEKALNVLQKSMKATGREFVELPPLERPFEELNNTAIAITRALQEIDDIRFDNIRREISRLSDQRIAVALAEGDIVTANNVRIAAERLITQTEVQQSNRRLDVIKKELEARREFIEDNKEDTVEQTRKKVDQSIKLERELTFEFLKEVKKRFESADKALDRLSAQENSLLQEQIRNAQRRVQTEQTIDDLRRGIDRAEAADRGEEARFIEAEAIDDLKEFNDTLSDLQRGIITTAQAEPKLSRLASSISSTITTLGQSPETRFAAVNLVDDLEDALERQDKIRERATDDSLRNVREAIKTTKQEFEDLKTSLRESAPIAIKTIINPPSVNDEGLNQIQKLFLERIGDAVTLTPEFDTENIKNQLNQLNTLLNKEAEKVSVGISPNLETKSFEEAKAIIKDTVLFTDNQFSGLAQKFRELGNEVKLVNELTLQQSSNLKLLFENSFSDLEGTASAERFRRITNSLSVAVSETTVGESFSETMIEAVDPVTKALGDGIQRALSLVTDGVDVVVSVRGGQTFSGGGLVNGPGTSTSDSIPAYLSDKEYVLRAKAVRSLGVNFLNALNERGIEALAHIPRFATGGLVGDVDNRSVARPDAVRDVVDVNLTIQGQRVRLQGNRAEVAALAKAAKTLRTTIIGG